MGRDLRLAAVRVVDGVPVRVRDGLQREALHLDHDDAERGRDDDEVREAAADHRLVVGDHIVGQGLQSGKHPSSPCVALSGRYSGISSANGVALGWGGVGRFEVGV